MNVCNLSHLEVVRERIHVIDRLRTKLYLLHKKIEDYSEKSSYSWHSLSMSEKY
jgi:hypothetical protein